MLNLVNFLLIIFFQVFNFTPWHPKSKMTNKYIHCYNIMFLGYDMWHAFPYQGFLYNDNKWRSKFTHDIFLFTHKATP